MSQGSERIWCSSWVAAPQDWNEPIPLPGYEQPALSYFKDQSVRQLVRPCIEGEAIRIRLSNVTGTEPVNVSAASIGVSAGSGHVVAGSLRGLTFSGESSVILPVGVEVCSDPIPMWVSAHVDLVLTVHLAAPTRFGTIHRSAFRTGWLIDGNAVELPMPSHLVEMTRTHWVSAVDVLTTRPHSVVVAFGDSLTDGTGSTLDARRRYPDLLSDRLTGAAVSVVNAGIAGNRMLHDRLGPRGSGRFPRDVLGQAGITHTIILQGINDIGFSLFSGPPLNFFPAEERVTATQVLLGLQAMIEMAHGHGVKVLLGTLLPFKGARYFNEGQEAERAEVNSWVRAQRSTVHAVVDFDVALRCEEDPLALRPAFDSGDHLHPNDAGYAAMAAAVPLDALY